MASINEQDEISTKVKLSLLHCPFTWDILDGMIKLSTCYRQNDVQHEDDYSMDNEASCSLESFLKYLYKCYNAVISADDEKAKIEIEKAEELLIKFRNEPDYCKTITAIEHVFYATKCFFLYNIEEMHELEEILENIIDIKNFNNEELGTLYGCHSVTCSFLKDYGIERAIDWGKKAVEKNQDCALWHFILAKNLRRLRRSISASSSATDEEKHNFEIAYALSKNHTFGIYYLQSRIEYFYKFGKDKHYMTKKIANEKEVLKIAKKLLNEKPSSCRVLLKLALMFLRTRVSDERLLAKQCLNAVEKVAPDNSTYLHYTAMLYEQSGDYKEAAKYFKKAAEYNNFVAELSYVQYGWEIGELEPLPHLLRMLNKYKDTIKERKITMLLAIAITYYNLYNDIQNAGEYFLKALTIDPFNKKFQIFYKFLDFQTRSVFSFLDNEFCILLDRKNCQEISLKIRKLLNIRNVTDLTEEFQAFSVNVK